MVVLVVADASLVSSLEIPPLGSLVPSSCAAFRLCSRHRRYARAAHKRLRSRQGAVQTVVLEDDAAAHPSLAHVENHDDVLETQRALSIDYVRHLLVCVM